MRAILKWPLIVAAVVVVLRVVVERAGAPRFVSNTISIAALTTVLGPLYFAIQIGLANKSRPYVKLVQCIFIYVVCARAMVLPTYWLARIFRWPEPRFAGLADSSPFQGFITFPLLTAAFWIVASLVSGSIIGFITLEIVRSRMKPGFAGDARIGNR
jgi:hypothetical protein